MKWAEVHKAESKPFARPTRTKSGKARKIPLPPKAVAVLQDARREANNGPRSDDLVFHGAKKGGRLQNFGRAWDKARIKAEIPRARFHWLRHEWASRYVENGGDLRSLQAVGGWSDLSLVERYADASFDRAAELMELASRPAADVVSIQNRAIGVTVASRVS